MTDHQKKYAELSWIQHYNTVQIGEMCGVAKSTVSRELSRARKAVQLEVNNAVRNYRSDNPGTLDLSIDVHFRLFKDTLSDYMGLVFQLHYVDDWKLCDIANALHKNKSTMSRNIHRCVGRILDLAQTPKATICHVERYTQYLSAVWTPRIEDGTFYSYFEGTVPRRPRNHMKRVDGLALNLKDDLIEIVRTDSHKHSALSYKIATEFLKHHPE